MFNWLVFIKALRPDGTPGVGGAEWLQGRVSGRMGAGGGIRAEQ